MSWVSRSVRAEDRHGSSVSLQESPGKATSWPFLGPAASPACPSYLGTCGMAPKGTVAGMRAAQGCQLQGVASQDAPTSQPFCVGLDLHEFRWRQTLHGMLRHLPSLDGCPWHIVRRSGAGTGAGRVITFAHQDEEAGLTRLGSLCRAT